MIRYSDHKIRNIRTISLRNLYIDSNLNSSQTDTTDKRSFENTPSKSSRKNSLILQIPLIGDQKRHLELLLLNNRKLVDSFVSLHNLSGGDDLIYVSGVVMSNMNPNFEVVLPKFTNNNSQKVKIKVWVKQSLVSSKLKSYGNWQLHQELHIDLTKLILFGFKLDDDEDFFTDNSVILNINGKYYTIKKFLKIEPQKLTQEEDSRFHKTALTSYKYNDIRSLASLTNSFNELIISKSKIETGISDLIHILDADKDHETIEFKVKRLTTQIAYLENEISKLKNSNESISKQVIVYKHRIEDLTHEVGEAIPSLNETLAKDIEITELQLIPIKDALKQSIYPSIVETLNEHTKIIQQMVAIDNIDNSIRFKIMGLEFPISKKELLDICYYNEHRLRNFNWDQSGVELEDHDANIFQINTGISYIIRVVEELAKITNTYLRYKIVVRNNDYFIRDPSELDSITEYPLFYLHEQSEKINNLSGIDRKVTLKNEKFERGFSLLNKNLVYLISHVTDTYSTYYHGTKTPQAATNTIPVDCLDNLLWNLQYIMLFLTAPFDIQT